MKKIKNFLPTKRKIIQLYFAVLFNANLKGFITGNIFQGATKSGCAPGINCYSCPGAIAACPLGSLQGAFSADHSTLYYVGGILLLYSIMFGRLICGWLCPFGLVQEVCYKIKTPKLKKSPATRLLSYLKYAILVFFVGIVPVMYAFRNTPLPAFCKYICPAGTLEGGIGLLSNAVNESYFSMLGPLFTWKFLLMVSILVGCVFIFRLFCRFLCPLGALYGLFNKISVFGIKVDTSKCTSCGLCHRECKVDIRHPGDQECISCGDCVSVCPTQAISWKGPKIFLSPNEGTPQESAKTKSKRKTVQIITASLMAAFLAAALLYYWNPAIFTGTPSSTVTPTEPSDISNPSEPSDVTEPPRGNQVGDLCYDYNLEVFTAEGFIGEIFDPTATEKITLINFWGTWCTPCVAELPYFDRIAQEYGDAVRIVAIHSAQGDEQKARDFIRDNYPNSSLIFSWDNGQGFTGEYYSALGGRGTYPYTVVLDESGTIRKIFVSSVTYEDLKNAVESILQAN